MPRGIARPACAVAFVSCAALSFVADAQDLSRAVATRLLTKCDLDTWKSFRLEPTSAKQARELGLYGAGGLHPSLRGLFEDYGSGMRPVRLAQPLTWDIAVTGIADDLFGYKEVQFTAKPVRLPNWLASADPAGTGSGRASFRKFDDGWRCERVSLSHPSLEIRWDLVPGAATAVEDGKQRKLAAAEAAERSRLEQPLRDAKLAAAYMSGAEFDCNQNRGAWLPQSTCRIRFTLVDPESSRVDCEISWVDEKAPGFMDPRNKEGNTTKYLPPRKCGGTMAGDTVTVTDNTNLDATGKPCPITFRIQHLYTPGLAQQWLKGTWTACGFGTQPPAPLTMMKR